VSATTTGDDRLRDAHPAASLAVTTLTVVTVIALCRVFPDWAYLRPMLAVAIGTHVVAFVLRVVRAPLWVALPVLLFVVFVLLGLVYYRDTLNFLLPSGRTIELMRIDLRLVLDQFSSAVAPVPSEGSFATATAATVAVCAVLADTFAFRAFGRVEAIVPTGVLFIFTSALGTDNHRVVVAALWIGTALATIAVLRFDQHEQDATWMGSRRLTLLAALPAILVTIGLGAVAAGAVAPKLPGAGEKALIDTRNRQSSVTEVLSPLVDIRARMKNRGNTQLFTMQSSDGAHYWRAIGLTQFDGSSWGPGSEELNEMGDRSSEVLVGGPRVTQILTVKGLRDQLVPAAYHPVQIARDDVDWASESDTLIMQKGVTLERDDVVALASIISDLTPEVLRAASVDGAPEGSTSLPSGFPDTAHDAAVEVTAGAATPFDQALALQTFFQQNFTYDLDVQLGNSNDAIEAFLRDRRGFCQQFAGTFAAMARSIGLPARVAVGYTPGDFGSDGLFHVYGRHAHAWPEVWFNGIGWVGFEPTPGRGSPDGSYTGLEPSQDDSRGSGTNNGTPGAATSVPERDPSDPDTSSTLPGQGGRGPGSGSTTTTTRVGASGSGGSGGGTVALVLFGAVVLLALWVLLAPRAIAAFNRRGHRNPRDRVVIAWHRACHSLVLAGAPPVAGATPLEYADTAEVATGVDHRTLRELAVQVTRAVYAPVGVDDVVATRCETLEAEVDAMCRTRTPLIVRLRCMVDPRLMRRRLAG
jgi:transglutaminase-like putative cysteine protease